MIYDPLHLQSPVHLKWFHLSTALQFLGRSEMEGISQR